jgi:hypothetical protein
MSWRDVIFPPAKPDGRDTGLRFTDILFGFVIFQLFLRLQHFAALPWFVRWQLIAGATLVLASWIGFRRSLNRSDYQPKFFNLPLFRFVLDQAMVVLYFRIAVLSPINAKATVESSPLAHKTVVALLLIFALYAFWDVLGIAMAYARDGDTEKYKQIEGDVETDKPIKPNWLGMAITVSALVLFALLYFATHTRELDVLGAEIVFAVATGLLLLYRFAKEIRTSWIVRSADGGGEVGTTPTVGPAAPT